MGIQFYVEDKPDLTLPQETFFKAKLIEIKQRETSFPDRQTGQQVTRTKLDWWFEVQSDDQYNGRRVKATCNAEMDSTARNQPRIWAEALLNRDLAPGSQLNSDDLIGRVVEITVRHEEAKDHSRVYEVVDVIIPTGDESFTPQDVPPF